MSSVRYGEFTHPNDVIRRECKRFRLHDDRKYETFRMTTRKRDVFLFNLLVDTGDPHVLGILSQNKVLMESLG